MNAEKPGSLFPSTLWTQVLNVAESDSRKRRAAWEELAARYWRPVYVHIRAQRSRSGEEALDLTQSFFAWMIETAFPGRADPRRGRFRHFLKSALENFLRMDARARSRLKRGGDRRFISLDRADLSDAAGASPDSAYENAWKRELLMRAAMSLKEKYERCGKGIHFEIFRACVLEEVPAASHAELAARHGITPTDVNNYLMDAKRNFKELLKDLLAETVAAATELDEEFRELFGDQA
jgi:RNA polymerase sigma-70 factor (ECF subfamily)